MRWQFGTQSKVSFAVPNKKGQKWKKLNHRRSMNMSTAVKSVFETKPCERRLLNEHEIRGFLPIYREDRIHIDRAFCAGDALKVTLRPYIPDLYVRPPKHVTRVQIIHYVGQAAYVLAGCFAERGQLAPIDRAGYIERVLDERATFRSL